MALIERYIFKTAIGAFFACLLGLTAVIWITQALRELDLITGKGQTIIVFLIVTGLSLPAMITVISPVALFIACVYTLNKLNSDSELIVMSAAGMKPLKIMRPFLVLALFVSTLVGAMTLYVMPASFQGLRDVITRIRADFVANLVREGQFTTLDKGLTFHYRERSGQALLGIFMQDVREPGKVLVYIAERGQTMESEGRSYLVLEKGSIHRQISTAQKTGAAAGQDSSIVAFERYALDLSALTPEGGDAVYKPRERTTWGLIFADSNDAYVQANTGRFRAELHDRFSAWLYPLAMMLVAFAALGDPRTTRQGRGAAIATAIIAVGLLRIAGFAASSAAIRSPLAVLAIYAAPFLTCLGALLIILQPRLLKSLDLAMMRLQSFRLPGMKGA
jgi:lipopolysaccharide export system permease protein